MKKSIMLVLMMSIILLSGCGKKEDPHPEWDGMARAGDYLAVQTPEGFTLNESNDTLSLNGIYYFSWTHGTGTQITNSDGKEATVYDCQIYLISTQCSNAEAAQKSIEEWEKREMDSYQVTESFVITRNNVNFDCLSLVPQKADSPFLDGAAGFAVKDALAMSVEVFCTEGFSGEPESILESFLSGIYFD